MPLGTAKWLVWATPTFYTLPLGKGHTQPLSPTQGQAKFLWGLFLSSHFAVPKGTTVWLATFVRCLRHLLTTSSLLTVPIWCIWHYFVGNPCLMPLASFLCNRGSQYYSLLPFPSVVGHYKCPCSIHQNNESGRTNFCQIIFEFWPQIKGLCVNERVTRSKKRQFLMFFVKSWLINDYTDIYL